MKEKVSFSILNRPLSFNPWVFFLIFLTTHSLLTFGPFALPTKLMIILMGLALPFGLALKTTAKPISSSSPSQNNFYLSTPLAVLTIAAIIFTHFYHLSTLPHWISVDEGYESAMGIGLLNHWDWRLLWSPIPHEPLFDWLLGIYFKLIAPSIFSFRLFTTVISLATIGAAYWGSQPFVSKRVSFLFAAAMAFSYWTLILSRTGIVVILIPLFQCLSFGFLGRYLNADSSRSRWFAWSGLVLCTLLGFYSWTNWAGLALAIVIILISFHRRQPSLSKSPLWGFFAACGLGITPLVIARTAPGAMAHIGTIYHLNPLKTFIYNIVGIFWDGSVTFNFGSIWNGSLNPILGSLALLGSLFFFRQKNIFWFRLLPLAVFLSFLPALLASNDVELYRALPVFVFLILAAAAGAQCLLSASPLNKNTLTVALVLIISFGFDTFNYFSFDNHKGAAPEKSFARSSAFIQAHDLLTNLSRQSGPLYIFSSFITDYDNRTIDLGLYPINALQNPALTAKPPFWTAVMTNVNYIPFFTKTYPHTQVTLLKKGGDPSQSSNFIALLILPTQDISASTLSQWKEADAIFRKNNLDLLNKNAMTPWGDIADNFAPLSPNTQADPLARAVYWEKVGLFHFQGKNFKEAAEDYGRAIQQGYPAAHLYYNLSQSFQGLGAQAQARQAMQKALAIH